MIRIQIQSSVFCQVDNISIMVSNINSCHVDKEMKKENKAITNFFFSDCYITAGYSNVQ